MRSVSDRLARRGAVNSMLIKLEEVNKCRVVINDRIEGLVVIDIEASDEADAKNKATSAAKEHLKCNQITGAVAMNWLQLPDAWKRLNAKRS